MPSSFITRSSLRSSRNFSARTSRVARVSQPCTVFASAHFPLPAAVLGPVEAPPWARHTALPRIAALRHCSPERLERALQRQAEEGEPKRCMTQSLLVCVKVYSEANRNEHKHLVGQPLGNLVYSVQPKRRQKPRSGMPAYFRSVAEELRH